MLAVLFVGALTAPDAGAVTGAATVDMSVDTSDAAATSGFWDTIGGRWSLTSTRPLVPTLGSPAAITNPSYAANDVCAYQATAVGDVDGNGWDDVIFGCYGDDVGAVADAGSVFIAIRNGANTGFLPLVAVTHPTPAASDNCGQSVTAGDVNGDGRADLIMGCFHDDVGAAADAGSAVVFTRNVANTAFDPGVLLTAPFPGTSDTCSMFAAVAVGDVNADGRGDVAMGCRGGDVGGNGDAGSLLVYTRNAANTGFDAPAVLTHPSPVASDVCGTGVAAGDFNADGRDDLVMGCSFDDTGATNDTGSAVVFTRSAGNTGFDPAVVLTSPTLATSDSCGFNNATGDVNGDGRADVVMNCEGDSLFAGSSGSVVVFARNAGNTGFVAGVELWHPAPAAGDACGDSVTVTDLDGDGNDDVVAGCTLRDNVAGDAGSVIAWARNPTNTGFLPAIERITLSAAASDMCGSAVSAGDVNGDGLGDVVLDCGNDDVGAASDAGSVWVYLSTSNAIWTGVEPIGPGQVYRHPTPVAGDRCGLAVELGDVNYDGHDDIVTGCYGDDDAAGNDEGSVLVALRNAANTGFDTATRYGSPLPSANAQCGHGVAIGDINGDSKQDILQGCDVDDSYATNAGAFVIMRRNEANDGFTQARWTHSAPSGFDACGTSVALGDVNADEHDDMVVGCPYDENGAAVDTGSMLVFTRNATNNGFDVPTILTHPAMIASDWCGMSVASADVNGDGRDDVIMGCALDDVGVADQGSTVVFTRNAGNTGFDAGVVLVHPSAVASDSCGYELATGDVDGDGRIDLLMGCESDEVGAVTDAGSAVLFLRRTDNTGYLAGTVYSAPAPVAGDGCGDSVAIGDVTGDDRRDLILGCRNLDGGASDGGGAVVLARNAANTGFETGQVVTSAASGTTAGCGVHVATGDVNGDGRPELALGCFQADGAGTDTGEVVLREAKRALVQTLPIATTGRPITSVTLTAPRVANGGALPSLEASSDGGTTWDAVSSGVAHTFVSAGTTLLARARISDTASTGYAISPWVSDDIAVSYSYHEPRVTSTTPATLPQGRQGVVVSVNGTEFDVGATVGITGSGITITNTTWVSATRIDITVNVAGAATAGARNVTVTNPDTGTHTKTAALTITAPALTVSLSVLGFNAGARDSTPPYAFDMGSLIPGTTQLIGPVGSGQALAGSAVNVNVASDTDWLVQARGPNLTSGGNTIAIGQLAWKHFGVAEAWTPFATTDQTLDGNQAPTAGVTLSYDARLIVPGGQMAGAYSTSLTYTVLAQP